MAKATGKVNTYISGMKNGSHNNMQFIKSMSVMKYNNFSQRCQHAKFKREIKLQNKGEFSTIISEGKCKQICDLNQYI